jgi:hypothetical protein
MCATTLRRKRSGGEALSKLPSPPKKIQKMSTKIQKMLDSAFQLQPSKNDDFDAVGEDISSSNGWKVKLKLLKEFKTMYGDLEFCDSRVDEKRFKGFNVWVAGERRRIRVYKANPEKSTKKNAMKVKAMLALGLRGNPIKFPNGRQYMSNSEDTKKSMVP